MSQHPSSDLAAPTTPRIALIHAVYPAMAPVESAFARAWPLARRFNLIDDALPEDLQAAGGMTPAMMQRIARLAEHALAIGVDGVLFTCSAFGEAIDAVAARAAVPVLKPNQAMFENALRIGQRLGMLATFEPAALTMQREFDALARGRAGAFVLETLCLPEAMAAARAGDVATHDRLLAQAAPRLAHCDAVLLAHFSTSTALAGVQAVLACPVLSAPMAAVQTLRARVEGALAQAPT